MNRLEVLIVAGALGVGSILGSVAARWGQPTVTDQTGGMRDGEAIEAGASMADGTDASAVVGLDPLDAIRDQPVRSRRLVLVDRYCAGLDVAGVRRALLSVPDDGSSLNRELRDRLIGRWAELEPVAAADFAFAKKDANSRKAALQNVLRVWLGQDAAAAKKFFLGIKERELLEEGLLQTFFGAMARDDFADALKFSEALPKPFRATAIRSAFGAESERDPLAAATRAMALPEGDLRGHALYAAVTTWMANDQEAALAWALKAPSTPIAWSNNLLTASIHYWAVFDPAAAAKAVETLPSDADRDHLIESTASSWGQVDSEAAIAWLQAFPESKARTAAMQSVVNSWAYSDPAAATVFMATQPLNDESEETLTNLSRRWARLDPDAAFAWASTQENPAIEKVFVPNVLGKMAVQDPQKAVDALARIQNPQTRAAALQAIAKNWATQNFQDAARWVLDLPPTDESKAALRTVVGDGVMYNSPATGQWLETMQGDPRRDSAVEVYARGLRMFDPVAAMNWANTLANAEKRRPLVRDLVGDYASHTPEEARAWVTSQNLDPAERQALLKQIDDVIKRK